MWTFLRWTAIGLSLLIVGMVVFILIFDWNWARGIVASQASKAIGRTTTIAGDLDVDWSWPPIIRAQNIRVANAAWSPHPDMLTLRQLALQIDVWALFKGRVVLPMIELHEPVVRLESSVDGKPNWLFLTDQETPPSPQQAAPPTLPTIGHIALYTGRLNYHDYSTENTFTGTLRDMRARTTGPEQSIEVRGSGQFAANPFQLTVHAGALPALQADDPYPLKAQITFGEWRAQLDGMLIRPLQLTGVDLKVRLERASPDSAAASGASASSQPLYQLTGHLSRQNGAWKVAELQGTLDESDISSGHLVLTMKDRRPFLRVTLSSDTLNVDNLIDTLAGPQASEQQQQTEPDDAPAAPMLDMDVTRAVNGELNFQGQNVIIAEQTLVNVVAAATLQEGRLTLEPTFALAGGTVASQIDVEAHKDVFQSAIQADIDRVDLKQVMARFGRESTATGIVNGRIDLSVSGRTLTELLASVDGNASLGMTDEASDTEVQVNFATFESDAQEAARLVTLGGEGRVRGQPVQIKGRVGSLYAWHAGTQPYPVQVTVQLGETQAQLDGTLKQPQQFTHFDAQVSLRGPDPASLAALLPVSPPHLPAYQLAGQLTRTEKDWTLESFEGSLGNSDFAGTLALELGGERPFVRGDLRSQHLDLDELMTTMAQNEARDATPQEKSAAAQGEAGRAIPDVAFDPKLLQRLNADLHFQGQDIRVAKLSLTNVDVEAHIEKGHVRLIPKGELEGGTMRATIEASSQQEQLAGRIQTDIKQVDLNRILSKFDLKREAFGQVDGHIDLTGQGQSLATWLAAANGDVSLIMSGGQLHGLLIELVGLDVGEAIISAFAGKEDRVPIRCLVADFIVTDGRMQTQMLVFDTADTKLLGEGFIDLGNESVQFKLVPEAKDLSLFSAEAPVYIKGPLTDIAASPKLGEVLLSLATPVDIGDPEKVDCRALFDAAHKQREPSPP